MNDHNTEQQLRYLGEVCACLHRAGLDTTQIEDSQIPVEWNGAPLCRITGKGSVLCRREDVNTSQAENAFLCVEDIAARTLEYMTAMETAPQPEASGLEGDYRILADFNGTILAGTHSKHGIQFVTWDRDYDRTDVALRWRNTGAAEKWDRKSRVFAEILFWLHLITLFFGSGVLYSKDNNS